MIRQAISCDICGTEMLNANHWFVANDRGPELRISAWSAHNRLRPPPGTYADTSACTSSWTISWRKLSAFRSRPPATTGQHRFRNQNALTPALHRLQPFPCNPLPVIGSNVKDIDSSARLLTLASLTAERASASPHRLRAEAWKRERERQRLAEQASPPRRSLA